MKKSLIVVLSIFIMLTINPAKQVNSLTINQTTKEFLNFEILSTTMSADSITISGWAFINENQHFRTSTDHGIQLEFIGSTGSFIVNATLASISMTKSYEQLGLPYCAEGVYNSSTCNYYYENVGFSVSIPISRFNQGESYTTNIIVLAHSSKTYLKTPLYYPILDPITLRVGDFDYSMTSKLSDMSIKVIETPVYARKGPGKTATIWATGTNCSMTFTNKLYLKFGSVYSNVISKTILDNQTYYEVSAKLDVCVDMRRRIVEGSVLTPVWIPGMFVEYGGSPLIISSILVNTKPVIEASDITITLPITINLSDYAKCYDAEEGDLSSKIVVETTDYQPKAGIYSVTYYVEDKYGYFDRKTLNITVNSPTNEPPVINASNRTILRESLFDPYKDVTATDTEDGDLSSAVVAMNSIDTSILGDHELCYSVTDSATAQSIKCIIVTVFDNTDMMGRFRFVSKNNLFYQEEPPIVWNSLIEYLSGILSSKTILKSFSF